VIVEVILVVIDLGDVVIEIFVDIVDLEMQLIFYDEPHVGLVYITQCIDDMV
jgi:hypothetical protein